MLIWRQNLYSGYLADGPWIDDDFSIFIRFQTAHSFDFPPYLSMAIDVIIKIAYNNVESLRREREKNICRLACGLSIGFTSCLSKITPQPYPHILGAKESLQVPLSVHLLKQLAR